MVPSFCIASLHREDNAEVADGGVGVELAVAADGEGGGSQVGGAEGGLLLVIEGNGLCGIVEGVETIFVHPGQVAHPCQLQFSAVDFQRLCAFLRA